MHRSNSLPYGQFANWIRILWTPSLYPLLRSPASRKAMAIYVMTARIATLSDDSENNPMKLDPEELCGPKVQVITLGFPLVPEFSAWVGPQERKASLVRGLFINLTTSFAGSANNSGRHLRNGSVRLGEPSSSTWLARGGWQEFRRIALQDVIFKT